LLRHKTFGVFQARIVDWKGLLDICMLLLESQIEYGHRLPCMLYQVSILGVSAERSSLEQ
jgi:hypothetical protein